MSMASGVRISDGSLDWSGGVDSGRVATLESAANPHGLKRNQLAWLSNGTVRGGGITCRTGWVKLCEVHDSTALYQGGYMYEPPLANPYLMFSIGGRQYQIRVDTDNSVNDVTGIAANDNPPLEPQAYFCQGEEFLVIQAGDGTTLPLFWDGTTMRRSLGITNTTVAPGTPGVNEIPAATAMDYYQGRLWYANGRRYTAGDIVQGPSGTLGYGFRDAILNVTENPLAIGGDGFIVPSNAGNIRALNHPITLDTALGQGDLMIFTRKAIYALTVPVERNEWISSGSGTNNTTIPKQRLIQDNFGSYGDRCVVPVSGDLFYQSVDGIRSLAMALRYSQQWGNVPISTEEDRVLKFNDRSLMRYSSGVLFDNRLLQTALPIQTVVGPAFQGVIPLDFQLVGNIQEKSPAAWEGLHEGLDVLQLFTGDFGGRERCFAAVHSRLTDAIEVWEFTVDQKFHGTDDRTTWFTEFPSLTWSREFDLKKLDGGELWLDRITGTSNIDVYYRVDSNPCWTLWHSETVCAARTSCEDVTNPVCYPEQEYCEGYKTMLRLPVPPAPCVQYAGRPGTWGYAFQAKVVIKGFCRIRGFLMHALTKEQAPFEGLNC